MRKHNNIIDNKLNLFKSLNNIFNYNLFVNWFKDTAYTYFESRIIFELYFNINIYFIIYIFLQIKIDPV